MWGFCNPLDIKLFLAPKFGPLCHGWPALALGLHGSHPGTIWNTQETGIPAPLGKLLRQGLDVQFRLASNSWQFSCRSLPSAGTTGVRHHTQPLGS